MPDQTTLAKAVFFLKEQGKIKRQGEIAKDLKMSKGTLSAYVTGKTDPSPGFIEKFENHYGITLTSFTQNGTSHNGHQKATADEVLAMKNEIIEILKSENVRLKHQLDTSLVDFENTALMNRAMLVTIQQTFARALLNLEKGGLRKLSQQEQSHYLSILDKLNRQTSDLFEKMKKTGIGQNTGK